MIATNNITKPISHFDGSREERSAEFRIPASSSTNSFPLSPHTTRPLRRTSSATSFPSPQPQPLAHNEMRKYYSSHALAAGGERAQAARFIKSNTKKVGGADRAGAPRKDVAAANFTHSDLPLLARPQILIETARCDAVLGIASLF